MNPLDQAVEAVVRALGLTDAAIARRKAFLEFTDADTARLKALHEALQNLESDFVNAFYSHLLTFEETRRFISDPQSLDRLKRTQAAYFDRLTAGDYGPDYILNRLRVGIIHQRIGLTTQWYLGAYSKYLAGLLPEIWQRLERDPAAFVATCQALNKIVLLDMGLAIDTYIHADRQTILALKEYAEIVFASIPDGLVVLSSGLTILSANRAFLKQFGLAAQTIRGRPLMEVIAAEGLRERALEVLGRGIAQHDVPLSTGAAESTMRRPVRVTLTGIHLAEEEEEEEEARLLMIVEDVSEEERLREQAEETQAKLAAIVDHSSDAIFSRALDDTVTSWNVAAERILGYTAAETIGRDPVEIFPPRLQQQIAEYRKLVRAGQMVPNHETVLITKDGRHIDFAVSLSAIKDNSGHIIGTASILYDITERKRTEQALHDNAKRLRDLSRRLFTAAETERRNINRELHDRVGQSLAALNINLNIIRSQLPQQSLDAVGACFQDTQTLLEETVAQVRDIMADLHPPALDDCGLLAALRVYVESFGARLAMPITVHGEDLAPRLSLAAEMALFRVAQGALANAATHARAKRIQVLLAATPDRVTLTIADDGAGFDVARAALAHASWGLPIMRERAEAIGARLTVESTPGKGTRVVVEIEREAA